MLELKLKGSVRVLAERLRDRGVKVAEATLRSGDCRRLLEKVWVRRPRSVFSFGPTNGHDLRPIDELVDHVIDLKCRIGRVKADLEGKQYDRRCEVERDPRASARCIAHAAHVEQIAGLIATVIPALAARGVTPTYHTVAEELTKEGHPIHFHSVRRRAEYRRPILAFRGIFEPIKPFDPERDWLSRLSSEELGAMVVTLLAELRSLEKTFSAKLAG